MKPTLLLLATTALAFSQSTTQWMKKGDTLEASGKTREALAAYTAAEKADPNNAALLVKIAKQHGDLMPTLAGAARKEASRKSVEYSRRAVAANPRHSDSHLALALSIGKSTESMGARQKIEASREIKTSAETALRLNPRSDYAHHLLGRWHQEMASIGGASRAIAKIVYGGVPKGTYEEALQYFDTARKLRPNRLIHQIEYGRTLAMLDRKEEARKEIQKGLNMPNREADDLETKSRAQKTLREL